jgi:rhamnose utilization protein RhaD (predicted bifunctional aldolase and dehydrogenase)/NAD(P)-dependent dehydrogenase (short-subunit alcohol dehydrogenase family)
VHAFIPAKFVDHTHADAILALTNQLDAQKVVRDALGDDVIVLDYVRPGFDLALAVAKAYRASPSAEGIVLIKHGLITWGETARASYERTVDIVSRAEKYVTKRTAKVLGVKSATSRDKARVRYLAIASVLRGQLAVQTDNVDWPYDRFILQPLITDEVLAFVNREGAREIALTPPVTADHLIRTKSLPMWLDNPPYDEPDELSEHVATAIGDYRRQYAAYVERHASRMPEELHPFDSSPRVILVPGLGAVCAGRDIAAARIARDISEQTIAIKTKIAAMGVYEGLDEDHLFDMEYRIQQHAKLRREAHPLCRSVALVTGAAGAIGAGICEALLDAGCHVAVSDLPGDRLTKFVDALDRRHGGHVIAAPLDVTNRESVKKGFDLVTEAWGGVDLVIPNAGIAHVASLEELAEEDFQRLEKVNVDGMLNILAEAGRRFDVQGTGGDIVVVSTKNVFAPGAKFGAYSATKAAAHQLARIASLEFAERDVRVNMIAPDAVFSHGERQSGLWAEVGPDRMAARGLDLKGLEEYYRDRNLLKARVTAEHVAKAVLFFATRQTPTTGATLPVDGGLPDATPR